jgi:Tfp pilus assembly protein PilX
MGTTMRSPQMRTTERGVALIMVILVLLVLTVLGITAAMLMTQEDRISSRQDLQKAALYVAEAGLRQGEAILANTPATATNINLLLDHDSSSGAVTVAAPDPRPIQPPAWDIRHLGTYLTSGAGSSSELANREVVQLTGGASPFQKIRAYYSLYVRNNPEDRAPGGAQSPLTDYDWRLRLISVGFVTDNQGVQGDGSANVLAVKILEEEFNFSGFTNSYLGEKGGNPASTYSGTWSGQRGGGVAGP